MNSLAYSVYNINFLPIKFFPPLSKSYQFFGVGNLKSIFISFHCMQLVFSPLQVTVGTCCRGRISESVPVRRTQNYFVRHWHFHPLILTSIFQLIFDTINLLVFQFLIHSKCQFQDMEQVFRFHQHNDLILLYLLFLSF